jgi:hypothetical protein
MPRNEAFNDIAVHEHRVATLEFFWNACLAADLCEFVRDPDIDVKSIAAQVGGIFIAAF